MIGYPPIGTIGCTPTYGNFYDRTIAWLIQWFTATRQEYSRTWVNAKVNHAVVYVGHIDGYAKPQLVQAQPGGASFADWDSYGDSMIWIDPIVSYPKDLPLHPTEEQRQKIRAYAVDCAVKKIGYNYLDFIAIAIAQKRFGNHESWLADEWWGKRLSNDNRLICSQLADAAWESAGLHLYADGRPSGLITPSDELMLKAPESVR